MSDLDFDLSMSLKVKCEATIEHGVLLMFNSNIVSTR